MAHEILLKIEDLSLSFRREGGAGGDVLSRVNLGLATGEVLAVVGSSGAGKSLLAAAILGILPGNASASGSMYFEGSELTPELQAKLRGKEIALVPQSVAYLDPLMKVGKQADGHRKPYPTGKRRGLFRRFGLPEETENLYPFALSGGMARRVLVSTALLTEAKLIIADEPTPGMGMEQAMEALRLFRELADEGKAVLLITHDIDLAAAFADRIAVFYGGMNLETAPAADFQMGPAALRHPYTKALWRALPQNGFTPLPGFQPQPGRMPPGCPFAPRCPEAGEECHVQIPPLREIRGGEARCFHGA